MVPLLLAAVTIAFGVLGIVQAGRRRSEQQAILLPCLDVLSEPRHSIAPDGYPRLSGKLGGRRCSLAVIPDSLALRRLPQLWLTCAATSSYALPSLVITARPRGDDYVSNAFDYPRQVQAPPWLPRDVMVRVGVGQDLNVFQRFREPLAALFSDPLIKELSFGRKGFRLVYRLAEGERANHLLLRQCRFAARIDSTLLDRLRLHFKAFEAAMNESLADAA